jgi:hypothetical protein
MGDGYNFEQLKERILALSKATDWEVAKKEWALTDIFEAEELQTCQCGHFPIVEICEIHSRITNTTTEVGNRCIKRFLGFRSDLIFTALKRIRKDITKSLNADAITFFHSRKLLNDWEYGFLQNTFQKRILTSAQFETRKSINTKVLAAVRKRGFSGHG